MESYTNDLTPPGGSPELPGSQVPFRTSSVSGGISVVKAVVICVAAALATAGISGVLVYKFGQPDCEKKVSELMAQAVADKDAIKQKLADVTQKLEAAETAAVAIGTAVGETLTRFDGTNRALYASQKYRFSMMVNSLYSDGQDKCTLDPEGEPTLTKMDGIPVKVLVDVETGRFYVTPEYHFETTDSAGAKGCYRIEHDLAWANGYEGGASLEVTTGIKDEAGVRQYVSTALGGTCGDSVNIVARGDDAVDFDVVLKEDFAAEDAGEPPCGSNADFKMLYHPSSESVYYMPMGKSGSVDELVPQELVAY